jgi:tetratricopeptide (TPR) repeat protein
MKILRTSGDPMGAAVMDKPRRGAPRRNRAIGMLNKSATKRKLTRKEQRDLDIEIAFMEGVLARDKGYLEAWKVLAEDYSRRSRFQEGLQADEKLAQLIPENPEVLYNLACSYSLTKNVERAVETLTRAIAKGFSDFKWMLRDPDLVQLRRDPIFKKIWVAISALQAGVH